MVMMALYARQQKRHRCKEAEGCGAVWSWGGLPEEANLNCNLEDKRKPEWGG